MKAEFDRQLDLLVDRGYPHLAGLSEAEFRALAEPLGERAADLPARSDRGEGGSPFALVVKPELVSAAAAAELVEREGQRAVVSMLGTSGLVTFEPIDEVALPDSPLYLAFDFDTGAESRNVTPDDALASILSLGRSPLTLEEGIALATQHPETVARNAGYSLAGSRAGDRRVTAFWISGGAPKLGWCWAGNPHAWLGTASCAGRLAPR